MTSGGQAAVARATAAVFVDGRRAGSAVLVGPRYLVTAAHVLQRQDPRTLAKVAAEQVELEFPAQGPDGQPGRTAAARVDLGPVGAGADVAVLDLGEDRPGWLPAPVPVWPAARLPARVQVFGYPLAERLLKGVWRQFVVAGPATAGAVQLDWLADAGTFPGHSGGPVIDCAGHALAGILVEGAERGRFDRFVPVTLIARVWSALPRPWLMTGADPGEARSHFARRARGQRSAARGGDLFRGRRAALERIQGWLTADEPPGQALVITGQPGAGKSAVLARAALSAEAGRGGPGLAFHARDVTVGDFLTALADLTGMDTPASADELVTSLADLPGQSPVLVVLDALDEAASDRDRRQITEVLAELAVLPGLRVAVATRTMTVGSPFSQGGLLPALGATARDDPNLIDLDSDAYVDLDGLRQFAAALLAQDGMDHPGPPGAAWTQYRAQPAVCDRLGAVVAERAGRNFLVAAMAAVPLSTARTMTDPAAKGFDPAEIPSGVGEALEKDIDRLPGQRQELGRGLLTALAYARGIGLADQPWLAFAAALGYSATAADLDALRRSPVADYLHLTTSGDRGGRPVTRLFHQALNDELLVARHQPSDESALLDVLLGQARSVGWQAQYLSDHTAEHAVAAGRLDQLLEDREYLLAANPARLVPHLDAVRSDAARASAAVYRQDAHYLAELDRLMRASQLELTAYKLGYRSIAAGIAAAAPNRPWQTPWSHGRGTTAHQVLRGHMDTVWALAISVLPDGVPVIVSGGQDATIRVWRLDNGAPVGEPMYGHSDAVTSVAVGTLPDGTAVIVSVSADLFDGTVRLWRLADGVPIGEPRTYQQRAKAVGTLADGSLMVACVDDDGMARVWRLDDGSAVGNPLTTQGVAVDIGALPDGTPVMVSGDVHGTVQVRRLADGVQLGEPLPASSSPIGAVSVGTLPDSTPVVVVSTLESFPHDYEVRVWRLTDGSLVGEALICPNGAQSVAIASLPDGTPVIVTGGGNGTVQVWRLADAASGGEPQCGHTGRVVALATGTLPDGTAVIISAGGLSDTTVRVWRLADGAPVREPLPSGGTSSVAIGALPDGTPVIVSGGALFTGAVQVWRLADGAPVQGPQYIAELRGSMKLPVSVSCVATGNLPDGSPVIIGGENLGAVRVWRLADGTPVREPLHAHTALVRAVATGHLPDGSPVVVSGDTNGTVQVWRLADGTPVGEPLRAHTGSLSALVTGVLPDGTPVIVSSGRDVYEPDGAIRVWRLADCAPVKELIHGHRGSVLAIATGALGNGTLVVISGGADGTVRVWRLSDGMLLLPPLFLAPEPVEHLAVVDGIVITAAGSNLAVHRPVRPGLQANRHDVPVMATRLNWQ